MANPGMLYVNSKIVDRTSLPESLFHQWYEDVHIPDIFKTSGMGMALRWKSTQADVERPWLALYPVKDTAFFQSDEFKSIPVTSDMLPGPTKCVFDLADFDTRYYNLKQKNEREGAEGFGQYMTTIAFELPETATSRLSEHFQESILPSLSTCKGFKRCELFELAFARQNRMNPEEKKISDPPRYLVLVESDEAGVPYENVQKLQLSDTVSASFELMKAFQK